PANAASYHNRHLVVKSSLSPATAVEWCRAFLTASARLRGLCRLVDPQATRDTVPDGGQPPPALRRAVQRGRDQLLVLPPAPAGHLFPVGSVGPRGVSLRRQSAARDQPPAATGRLRRAARPLPVGGR